MALLNEINVKGVPHPIVTDDGYYSEMSVGDAEQLISSMYAENSEPYGYRTTGGSADVGNRAYLDKIVGGTVVWNQLYGNSVLTGSTIKGVTFTPQSDGTVVINGTPDGTDDIYYQITGEFSFGDHAVLLRGCPSGGSTLTYSVYLNNNNQLVDVGSGIVAKQVNQGKAFYIRILKQTTTTFNNVKFKPQIIDLTQMFGPTIADYVYSLEQSQAGAGVAWFKKLFPKGYYEYNAGELLSVEGLQSHDTVGFNQWDEEWEVGDISTSTGEDVTATNIIRSKGFMPCLPNVQYCFTASDGSLETALLPFFYDADKQFVSFGSWSNVQNVQATPQNCYYMRFKESMTYGTTYKNDICINLSDPSRNGEYEPYEKHSYPLDSSLTLRGIPKLDASNNLYYDGDEYTSDGKVKRKYGVVDLGMLQYSKSDYGFYSWGLQDQFKINRTESANCICSKYPTASDVDVPNGIYLRYDGATIITDTTYTDAVTFKEAMSGVMLVYELATPTMEEAEPFQHIQIVDDFGTEEFVSTGIVPVGHKTRYPANLRDKLQHLPDLAGMDGTYLIRQTGKQMSLVYMPAVFPETPTEDGTYTLKATVSGGTPTYVWEGVNAESEGE